MKKHILLASVIVLAVFMQRAVAQESTLLHFMNTTPQAMRSNPANIPDTVQMYFGVPFLANISVSATTPISWSDIFTKRNDSLFVKPGVANAVTSSSRVFAEFNYDIFTFGKRIDTVHFITVGLAAKGYGNIGVPQDAVELLVNGNSAFVNEPCIIDGSLLGQAFGELSFGYTYKINRNWQVGGRAKLLVGIYNAYSSSLKASLATDADTYNLLASSDILIKTAQIDSNPFDNVGASVDAGVYYKTPLKGLDVGVSLIDWGFIHWGSKVKYQESKNVNKPFSFEGFNDVGNIGDLMKNLVDTLKDQFSVRERDGESYTTKLKGRLFISASYDFQKYNKVGMLFRTDALQNFNNSALTIMYNRLVGDWFSVSVGNNFLFGQTYFNPSIAMNFKISTLQIYLAVENINATYIRDMKALSAQLGMTIVL